MLSSFFTLLSVGFFDPFSTRSSLNHLFNFYCPSMLHVAHNRVEIFYFKSVYTSRVNYMYQKNIITKFEGKWLQFLRVCFAPPKNCFTDLWHQLAFLKLVYECDLFTKVIVEGVFFDIFLEDSVCVCVNNIINHGLTAVQQQRLTIDLKENHSLLTKTNVS